MPFTLDTDSRSSGGEPAVRRSGRPARRLVAALAVAAAGGVAVLPATAGASSGSVAPPASPAVQPLLPGVAFTYAYENLGDAADPTFNQLLGINDLGTIVGYYGSGSPASTRPNKGFTISPYSSRSFADENYPGSQQTQVTGLNDMGKTVGFYLTGSGATFGFFAKDGIFTSVRDPEATAKPTATQLLGVNNEGLAAGFYQDAAGKAHAFTYDTHTGVFTPVTVPGAVSTMATGVNDAGEIVGTVTLAGKVTDGFVLAGGKVHLLAHPGSRDTQAFGVNDAGEVVGQYTSQTKTHGFVETTAGFVRVDDPAGQGTTTVNGINNAGDLVGFYTDAAGDCVGFLAEPEYFRAGS